MPKATTAEQEVCYHFSGFRLCPRTRELSHDGVRVAIECRVFDLLAYLVENHDRAVAKQEIEEAVWGGKPLSETVLAHSIMKARLALNDTAEPRRCIHTVRAFGYRFVGEVSEQVLITNTADHSTTEFEGTASGPSSPQSLHVAHPSRWRRRFALPVACLILLFGIAGAYLYISPYFGDRPYKVITILLPPVRAEPEAIASLALRVTMLFDRQLSKLPWLEVTAIPQIPEPGVTLSADYVLITEMRRTQQGCEMSFKLQRPDGSAIMGRATSRSPFHAAGVIVKRVSALTRNAATQ